MLKKGRVITDSGGGGGTVITDYFTLTLLSPPCKIGLNTLFPIKYLKELKKFLYSQKFISQNLLSISLYVNSK